MKHRISTRNLLIVALLYGTSSTHAALDLNDIVKKAKLYSPTMQTANQQVLNSEELYSQAKGIAIPRLTLNVNRMWQDYVSPFAPSRIQSNYSLGLDQQLFNGYREYQGIRLYSESLERQKLLYLSTEIALTESLINSYYAIKILEQNQKNLAEQKKILNDRLKELAGRTKIGKSRKSETIMARTQLMNAEISIQTIERQIDSEWLNLTKLSGVERTPLMATPLAIGQLDSYPTYQKKISNHPALHAVDKNIEIAENQIGIEKADHFPKISFRGNYYLDRDGYANNQLTWDLAVTITLPLFEGGVAQSQVRQAVIQKNAATISQREIEINLNTEVSTLYKMLEQDFVRLKFMKETLELSYQNYQIQRKDSNLGLVNTLEVLQALTTYIETKKTYDTMKLEVDRNYLLLQVKTGQRI